MQALVSELDLSGRACLSKDIGWRIYDIIKKHHVFFGNYVINNCHGGI